MRHFGAWHGMPWQTRNPSLLPQRVLWCFWNHWLNQQQNKKKYFAVPGQLVSPADAVCGWCKLTSDLDPHICWGNSNWSSRMQIRSNLHFQVVLQVDFRWPLTLICDLLTPWTNEGTHIISINQVWFKSDFNFSNEATFTFSAHLTTWPQMTFDLDMYTRGPNDSWKFWLI